MKVIVFGSSGYKASKLVPALIAKGYDVGKFDLAQGHDVRNIEQVKESLVGADAVIHLACVSNDPSYDMNPEVSKTINYDSFRPLVKASKDAGIKRFIFASSSSVYGVREEKDVIETTPLTPLTDYSKYKAMCEEVLLDEREPGFETVIIRPATVCGMAPAVRLDLCVHILTMAALRKREISVFGGGQYRPNIHIDDIVDAYIKLLEAPADKVDGEIFNCGHQNLTIMETAAMIKNVIGGDIKIVFTPSTDNRSYHVSSEKIGRILGFYPYRPIGQAIMEITEAWNSGAILNPEDPKYYAIQRLKGIL